MKIKNNNVIVEGTSNYLYLGGTDLSDARVRMRWDGTRWEISGVNGTNNESLRANLESVANQITFDSGTGVTTLVLSFNTIKAGEYLDSASSSATGLQFPDSTDIATLVAGGVEFFRIDGDLGLIGVFNEGGADLDFRVEGDTDQNLIKTDAASDTAQIGAAATIESNKFYVAGRSGVQAGSASSKSAKQGGVLHVLTSDVGNVGTGEDTLLSYTVPANTLSVDGDHLTFRAQLTIASNVNSKTIRVKFGGTTFLSSTSIIGTGGTVVLSGSIYRTGASTQDCEASLISNVFTNDAQATNSGETLSGTVNFLITGEAVANNDIILDNAAIYWYPNNT